MTHHEGTAWPRRRGPSVADALQKDAETGNYPSAEHFEAIVTDRVIEEPWVVSRVQPGERLLDVGSATSRYLREIAIDCRVSAIDLRPTHAQPGVAVFRGDVFNAPFRSGSFDVITCVSTIEHVGLAIYDQGLDEFGDEVAMRHMRSLLLPGGRLLLTTPFGSAIVAAWLRVYNKASFRRLIGGYRVISLEYYRYDGDQYVPCERDEIDAAFDYTNMRSGGLVLAELTPADGLSFLLARLSLRLRRTLRQLTHRGPFWTDPRSGKNAGAWMHKLADIRSKRAGRQ